ncbi:hypothetical protein BFF78_01530 [Streptomyces fodineus]|uniref:PknH-like extracellular domain-containing protein n=1 Tax=Streptomyces fodineus TaxID=1904616 RepID=A0A1D7Y2X3_9ACTN|nr:hypothetical protein [Streptomyces fodineus]AOR29934.1 hypothetical protein BFF78_01530 [Streptomyces fodineus]
MHSAAKRSRAGSASAASGLLVAGLLLAGCTAGASSPAPVAGTPTPTGPHQLSALPITHYQPTAAQEAVLTRAAAVLVRACMKRSGLNYTVPTVTTAGVGDDPSGDLPDNDPAFAAVHGYRDRSQAAAQVAHERRAKPATPLNPKIATALVGTSAPGHHASTGGCLGQARRTIAGAAAKDPDAFFGNPQLVTDIRMNSYFKALSDGRVKDAFSAWSTCMKAKGFHYASPVTAVDDRRWSALRPPTTLEIRTATADVACKYRHNVDGVFHAVQAAYETAAIRANLGALQAIRTGFVNALATAARINADAPERPS